MKYKTLLLTSMLTANVFATDVNVLWDAPTKRTDGTAFTTTDIKDFTVAITQRGTSNTISLVTDPSDRSASFSDIDPGYYVASVIVTDTNGNSSKPAVLEFTIPAMPLSVSGAAVIVKIKTVEEIIRTVEETYKVQ